MGKVYKYIEIMVLDEKGIDIDIRVTHCSSNREKVISLTEKNGKRIIKSLRISNKPLK